MQRPVTVDGQRAAALRFADPRVQALSHVLLLFVLVQGTFPHRDLRKWLHCSGKSRADSSRDRPHTTCDAIERIPKSYRYRITASGLRTAIFYTRLYNRALRTGLAIISQRAIDYELPIAKSIRAAEVTVNWYDDEKLAG
jgi:hypothetical protein